MRWLCIDDRKIAIDRIAFANGYIGSVKRDHASHQLEEVNASSAVLREAIDDTNAILGITFCRRLKAILENYPDFPQIHELFVDRANHDPDEQLREFVQQKLTELGIQNPEAIE